MDFSILSQDALRVLCSYLDCLDLLKVWLLGCRVLNTKLFAAGTIESLTCVAYSSDSKSKAIFPSFLPLLGSLSALTVSIHRNEVISYSSPLEQYDFCENFSWESQTGTIKRFPRASDFASLPRSLTFLSSKVVLDYVLFMEACTSDATLFPNLRTLELGGCISLPGPELLQVWPSSLTALSLTEDRRLLSRYGDLLPLELDLGALPTTLERFKCFGLKIAPCAFPASLLELQLEASQCPFDIFAHLPNGLQKITLATGDDGSEQPRSFSQFPSSLEYLSMNFGPEELEESFIDALSRATCLKTLVMTYMPWDVQSFLTSLPSQLETFKLLYYCGTMEDFVGVELPKTLTELEINGIFGSWEQLCGVPASCVSINLDVASLNAIEASPNSVQPISSLLQRFTQLHTLDVLEWPANESFFPIPATLTTLNCSPLFMNRQFIPDLKMTSITTIIISCDPESDWEEKIDALLAQWLPNTLTHLSIDLRGNDACGILVPPEEGSHAMFPPSLTILSLLGVSGSDPKWLKLLPRGLKELELEWKPGEAQQFWEPIDESSAHSPSLPPSLTIVTLRLNVRTRMVLLGILGSVERLQNLSELNLAPSHTPGSVPLFSAPLEARDLLLLPKTTTRFSLGLPTTEMDFEEDARFLPRRCCLLLDE